MNTEPQGGFRLIHSETVHGNIDKIDFGTPAFCYLRNNELVMMTEA